jgi:hypothetical protein
MYVYIYVTGGLPVNDTALYGCLQITSQIHYQTKHMIISALALTALKHQDTVKISSV